MKKILLAAGMMASIALSSVSAFAEEKVTVYTAVPQIFIDELVPMFEKQTGVNVEIIKAGSGELLNRLTAEAARPMADVLWSVDSSVVDFNPTLFEAYDPNYRCPIGGNKRKREGEPILCRCHGIHRE